MPRASDRTLWTRLAVCFITACAAVPSGAAEVFEVELFDGRRMNGQWVERGDKQHFWLLSSAAGIEICSGFRCSDVRSTKPHDMMSRMPQFPGIDERQHAGRTRHDLELPPPPPGERRPGLRSRIKSLHVEARLAQWDDDVQSDGLQIHVFPLDARGALAAVNGEIEFRLLGEIEPHSGGNHDRLTPKFRELERSTSLVRLADFANGAAVYNLPFSQLHPDFNLDVASSAIVHARLGVPGQGAFESFDAQVELRDFSRIGDQLQLHSPQRFFPIESGARPNR